MTRRKRKHFKIDTLPEEVREAVNKLLTDGFTYQQIADYLRKMGHEVGTSSVGRYSREFLARLERLKVAKDQARAIVQEMGDGPATEMHEAANQLAVQMVMETLMEVTSLEGEKVADLLKALAQLERSAVSREKLKYDMDQGIRAAMERLKKELRQVLTGHPDLLAQIMELVDRTQEQGAG